MPIRHFLDLKTKKVLKTGNNWGFVLKKKGKQYLVLADSLPPLPKTRIRFSYQV